MKLQVNNFLPIIDLGGNIEKTIFLSSSARSGSTFFANLLNYKKKYRILFEPLSLDNVESARGINFPSYISEDDDELKYKDYFSDIVSGQISNTWIDRENKAGIYCRRLVKEVRSNLLLPWIIKNFPEIKIILLIRNPLLVINSWTRLKFEDGFVLRELILQQKEFLKKIPKQILNEYLLEKDPYLLSIYYWCITNSFPIKNPNFKAIKVVKYEDIVDKKQSAIKDILDFTGIDTSKVSDDIFNKFSSSSGFKKQDWTEQLYRLKQSLGKETLEKAQNIMERFEISHLYTLNLED